ncbi:putative RNA-directed DNA polymerase [Helianthus annuus]|nr:putative RNA-directed DNA polymerase [Helianthus annuus]
MWLKGLLEDMKGQPEVRLCWCDNSSTIKLSKNPVMHHRTKHMIDVRFHYLRDLVNDEEVKLAYCPTKDQLVDAMTKPGKLKTFERLRRMMGVVDLGD